MRTTAQPHPHGFVGSGSRGQRVVLCVACGSITQAPLVARMGNLSKDLRREPTKEGATQIRQAARRVPALVTFGLTYVISTSCCDPWQVCDEEA